MYLKIKVFPNSKKQEISKKSADNWEIKIKAKPTAGLANAEVKTLLAKELNVLANKIRLIKGARQRSKIYEIDI
jgi:uncharacterized protein YggU (UPF0235/DUF167 family)